ncbi:HNH endonuclease [Sagittula sp. NFXS13]|uniref:HNH endonuclease n=1 Tax=Sagittula sp. NFXS13 TaxID=2819095 RepID=UPI0032E00F00
MGSLPMRMGRAAGSEAERNRARDAAQPWRAWYKTRRWQTLRQDILKRDGFRCQATGVMLIGTYPAANSPVIDHKTPHRGDLALFWDPENLQAVSKAYHDGEKQRLERSGRV